MNYLNIQPHKSYELDNSGIELPRESVPLKMEFLQILELEQAFWKIPRQIVAIQKQLLQI